MRTDAELLRCYAMQEDERAFADLVQRHLGLVYATALRSTGGRAHLAEEIAQKVFTDLARKSASLCQHPVLSGWLYRSARYAAMETNRAESRRQRINRTYADMPEAGAATESTPDWEQLRPVLDGALEGLREGDRQLMLLRFFQGMTFPEIGARLALSENAARMRTERAMEKLRAHLGRRGVTSSAAALGLLLANQAAAAPPRELAASVTNIALAAAPAGQGFFAFVPSSKLAISALSGAAALGFTSFLWNVSGRGAGGEELAVLRAENARLRQATASGASMVSVKMVADEFAAQAATLMEAVAQRLELRRGAGPSRYRDRGQATPYEAFLSYAWALDTGNAAALGRILTYDESGWESIRRIHAGMPGAVRAQYPSPEQFIVTLYIADTLLNPVPDADVAAKFTVTEIAPGVAAVRRPGSGRGGMKWIRTDEGWKIEVPAKYPDHLVQRILGNAMLARLGQS
jgi:RNA polymerase sigma factor (sigma-70 family)